MTMSPTQRPGGKLGFWLSLMTALGNVENMPVSVNISYIIVLKFITGVGCIMLVIVLHFCPFLCRLIIFASVQVFNIKLLLFMGLLLEIRMFRKKKKVNYLSLPMVLYIAFSPPHSHLA